MASSTESCTLSFVARLSFVLVAALLLCAPAAATQHSLGLGAQFWKTLDDLADDGFDDVEEDGFAYVASWKVEPQGLFFFELDVEYFDDGFGGSTDSTVGPSVFVGIGHNWYAAAGVGVNFSSDFEDDVSDPFWVGRVGKDFHLLPGIRLDIHLNYRADAFEELENASTDAITLGALVRFDF